jgi:plasmid stabilization system protein ParE
LIVRWTSRANLDLKRLHDFLVDKSPAAAQRVARTLSRATDRLKDFPRMGVRLEAFGDSEVRRIIVGDYEIRHEILGETIWVIQLWHCREDR